MDIGRIARRAAVGGVAVAGGVALQQAVAGAEDGTSTVTDTVTKTVRKAPAAVRQAVSADTATNTATNVIKRTVPKAKAAIGTASISTTAANPVKTVSNTLVKTTNQLASAAIAPAPQLFIQITSPLPNTIVDPDDPLLVTGIIGGPRTNVYYVLDASNSTRECMSGSCAVELVGFGDGAGAAGGDPACSPSGSVFDCEVASIIALNNAIDIHNVNATLITFWGSDLDDEGSEDDPDVQLRDLIEGPGTSFQLPANADTDDDGVTNIVEAVGGESIPGDDEDDEDDGFEQVLDLLNNIINPVTAGLSLEQAEQNIVFFFSDGVHFFGRGGDVNFVDLGPDGVDDLAALAAKGVQIFSFSVGTPFDDQVFTPLDATTAASGCGFGTVLQGMADATGGTCTEVDDPSDATAVLGGIQFGEIDFAGLNVNGTIFEITNIDVDGNWSVLLPGGILHLGNNPIQAFVFGDGGASFAEDFTNVIALDDEVVVQDFDDECEDDDDCDDDVDGDLPTTGADNSGRLAATGLGTLLAGGLMVGGGRHRRRRRAH